MKFDFGIRHVEWKEFRKLLRLIRNVRRSSTEKGRKMGKVASTSTWIHIVTLRGKQLLRNFENSTERKIFAPKREGVTEGLRQWNN
jgi:hypothetical protein